MKKTKSLPKLKAELQKIFNEFIRLRDKNKPCISCGEFKPLQAGHFYSVRGYDGLRFNELNAHGECAKCNCFDDMHLLNYASNLPGRIGKDKCELLEIQARDYKKNGYKWSRTELLEKIRYYKEEVKQLSA
jgi:hypothetical protein